MQKIVILTLLLAAVMTHKCIHDEIVDKIQVDEIPVKKERMMSESGQFRPLEIKVIWASLDGASEEEKEYATKKMIPYSLNYISKVLTVNSRKKLDLTHLKERMDLLAAKGIKYVPKCREHEIPMEMIENPIDEDYVMFVTVGQDSAKANTLAYAASCMRDMNHNGRSVMGISFFNTAVMRLNMHNFQDNVETAIHEFLHAFGFSSSMYKHFLDEDGKPRGDEVIKKVTRRGKETNLLMLPKLTKLAQEYFGCDSIDGVEMENQGGGGSLGSHFEARIIRDDLMVSHSALNLQFTEFLAVLLEETGWYRVNRKMVGKAITGYKAGCEYLEEKCVKSYDSSTKTAEVVNEDDFCGQINKKSGMCNTGLTHPAYCGSYHSVNGLDLDPAFDYFNGLLMAGANSDNCPLKQAFQSSNCRDDSNGNKDKYYPQIKGDKSRCVTGDYYYDGWQRKQGTRCVKAECVSGGSAVKLDLGNGVKAYCHKGQGSIDLTGKVADNGEKIEGSLDCPNVDRMCISVSQEYFDNPDRFPYEDVTKSSTITDAQTGLSVFGTREQRQAAHSKQGAFDDKKIAARFAAFAAAIFGSGKIIGDAYGCVQAGIFVSGRYGDDGIMAKNAIDFFRTKWRVSERTVNRLVKKLTEIAKDTARLTEGEEDAEDDEDNDEEQEQKPKKETKRIKCKYALTSILQAKVLTHASKSYQVNGWVGDDLRSMCAHVTENIDLYSPDHELIDAFINAYNHVWTAGWAVSYRPSFVKIFRNALPDVKAVLNKQR